MAHQLRMVFAFVKGCKKQNENMQQRRCVCVCVLSRSVVSYALRPCGLYSLLGFSVHGRIPDKNSRQEHWSGLPFPPAGDLPDPGTEPAAPTSSELAGGFSATSATCKAPNWFYKTNIFSVVMYGCESCTKKKAEHRRIDGF